VARRRPARGRGGGGPRNNTVGKQIALRLQQLERTAAWLARKLNRHPTTVTGWINGLHAPSVTTLREIALVLDVTVAWLLGEATAAESSA
jgi:transcriptional regulator with XRE-family HTH domain